MGAATRLEDRRAQGLVVEGVARRLRVARLLRVFERRVYGTLGAHEDGPLVVVILRARQAIGGGCIQLRVEDATAVAKDCRSSFSKVDGVAVGEGVARRLCSLRQYNIVIGVKAMRGSNSRTPRQDEAVAKVGQRLPAPERRHRRARNFADLVGKRLARSFIVGHGVNGPTAARQPQVGA